jgi:hypothetical protein
MKPNHDQTLGLKRFLKPLGGYKEFNTLGLKPSGIKHLVTPLGL